MKATKPFCALGVDVGGTKIAAGIVRFPEGQVVLKRAIPTNASRGGEAVLRDVEAIAGELARSTTGSGLQVHAIGIGVCELVDLRGHVVSGGTVNWQGVPVDERLGRIAPVIIEADVRAAALAEAEFGAGRGCRSLLYVTIGTGISCSLVLDGRPHAGARGAAGTMASTSLSAICSECGSEERRSLEEIASGPGLVASYNRRASESAQSAEQVLALAEAGDSIAQAVVKDAAKRVGTAVGLLVDVLDPERVIVGGGLGSSAGMYWKHLMASARRQIWSNLNRDLAIVQAALGTDSGLIGAAAAAWKRHRTS